NRCIGKIGRSGRLIAETGNVACDAEDLADPCIVGAGPDAFCIEQRTERNIVSEIACQLVTDPGVALARNRANVDADRSAIRYRIDVQSAFDRADIERRAAENGVPGEIEI